MFHDFYSFIKIFANSDSTALKTFSNTYFVVQNGTGSLSLGHSALLTVLNLLSQYIENTLGMN